MRYALLPLVVLCSFGQTKIDLTQQVRGRLPGANMDNNTVYVSQQIDWSSRVGWLNMAAGSITMPESTYASLPAAVGNSGKRFTVTDCLTSACTAGGGSTVVDVRSNGVAWVVISGGSDQVATATPAANAIPKSGADGKLDAGWLPGNGYAANISSATTWTVTGATHGLATSDLDVWVRLDGGTKWIKVDPASVDINKTSYDVNVTWAVATAGRIVIVKMGVGGGLGGESTSVANSGATGASVLKTGTNVTARKIKAGANCTVTENTDDIEVTCTGGGSGDVTEVQAGTGLAVTSGTGPIPSLRLAINGDTGQACSGTDKVRALSSAGIVTCAADSGGGGTGDLTDLVAGAGISITTPEGPIPTIAVAASVAKYVLFANVDVNFVSKATGQCDTQALAVSGILQNDMVFMVTPGTFQAGWFILQGRASANNTVDVTACNFSGSTSDPPQYTTSVIALRGH